MHLEITIALNYLSTHLYNKLPRRRINLFSDILNSALCLKYANHWYPAEPSRGSAYRSLKPSDPLIKYATLEANVSYGDVLEALPKELTIWVDPGEVSYSIGEEQGVIWRGDFGGDLAGHGVWGMPDEEEELIGVNQVPAAPQQQLAQAIQVIAPLAPLAQAAAVPAQPKKPPSLMTTAAFAQTKFGSTKLKSTQTRRSNNSSRMSPTEFSNYIKQKQLEQEQAQAQQATYYDVWDFGVVAN